MANVTMAQIKKMNAAMADGWSVDFQRLVLWNEKTAERRTEPDENGVIYEASLHYIDERTGEGWSAKATGNKLVELTVKKLTPAKSNRPEDECAMYEVNYIMDKIIGEPKTKKMFNYIQKLTHEVDFDEVIKEAIDGQDTAEEAPDPVEVDENSEVTEGMRFTDADGKTFEITELNDMSVTFNGGERALFDFGTSRTIKSVLDALGNGAKLTSNGNSTTEETEAEPNESTTAEEETATENAQTPETETSEEEPTADTETATDTATEPQAEEPTEGKETAQTDEEQPTTAPETENNKPDYSALAATYFTGKTIKATKTPKKAPQEETTPEPEPTATEDESEPQTPPKTAPGYTGEPSDILTEEEAERLTKGEQVRKESENYKRIFTTVQYTDRTALLYSVDRYQYRGEECDPLQPKNDFHYIGFITDNKTYINAETIQEEMRNDIAEELRRMIPDEETARANAESFEDWQRRTIENAEQYGANDAKNMFYKDETPQLYLYSHMEKIKSVDVIRYIEDPAQVVTEYATAYAESHAAEIAADYIRYNLLTAAIKAIKDNPSDPAHTIKKISHCIGEKIKTAKVELTNGEVVTVEARAIRGITHGTISNYYVKAYDRDKLPKNEYNRPEDIQPEQIKAIYHGQRTLYRAA